MNDPAIVRLAERFTRLQEEVARVVDGERASVGEGLREVSPSQVLHHDERRAIRESAHLEDANDVLALDCCRCARLTEEARDSAVARSMLRTEKFDRDGPSERGVDRSHDDAHAARADDGLDTVLAADDIARPWERPTAPAAIGRIHEPPSVTSDCLARNRRFTYRTPA